MTYDELGALLEPLGFPIVYPGETDAALPCFLLNPLGITIFENYPVAYEIVEVSARVPLDQNNPAHWEACRLMAYAAMSAFMGTPVQFDAETEVSTTLDTNPQQIVYTLTVQFPGEPIYKEDVYLTAQETGDMIRYLVRQG